MTSWERIAQTLVVTLLGTGGATFVWTMFKSVIAYRDSAEGREDKAIARLEQFERDCRTQLAAARAMEAWWCRRAGDLEFALIQAGLPRPPEHPRPHADHEDDR